MTGAGDKFRKDPSPGPIVPSLILDSISQGVFWKDYDSVFLGCNMAFARAAGLDRPDDILGKTDFDLPWPRTDAEAAAYVSTDREVIRSGRTKHAILESILLDDETRIWIETTKVPLRDEDGNVIGVLGLFTDVTERHEQALDIRETKHMLQTVLDNIPARVFWKDLDCVYRGCNRLFAGDAGLDHPEALIGRTDFDQGWSEQAEDYRADDRSVMETGKAKIGYEEPQTTPEGDRIWLRTNKVPLRDLDGAIIGVLGTYEDITDEKAAGEEQRRLENRIQHAQKLESLGILAGGIAHDFNNLLAAILGHTELALEELPPATAGSQSMEEVRTAALRARDLTNQMLAYSGKGRFVVRSLQLGEVVREMGNLLEASIPKKVGLRYELADGLPAVEVDVAQIRQVVMNLVTNGAEAIGENSGLITLKTGSQQITAEYMSSLPLQEDLPPGDYVFLEVSDDGCGMDSETRDRLFEPFFTTKFQGRGLGLAAVQGIVRGHDGAIQIVSEPGRGSSFKLLLPVGLGNAPAEDDEGREGATELPLEGTVLVVDDEDNVRRVATQMLKRCGLRVLTARDGYDALAVYRDHRDEIVMVLLDMTMPRMDGEETFRELRALDPEARVVLSSGYNEQDAMNRFVGKGLAGFIQKPFTLRDLRALVRKNLES